MATPILKRYHRETVQTVGHYGRPVVITLAPGSASRPEMIGLRLKGTRAQYVARVEDVFRTLALWHASKVSAAKRAARKAGVPWRVAKRQFDKTNSI